MCLSNRKRFSQAREMKPRITSVMQDVGDCLAAPNFGQFMLRKLSESRACFPRRHVVLNGRDAHQGNAEGEALVSCESDFRQRKTTLTAPSLAYANERCHYMLIVTTSCRSHSCSAHCAAVIHVLFMTFSRHQLRSSVRSDERSMSQATAW